MTRKPTTVANNAPAPITFGLDNDAALELWKALVYRIICETARAVDVFSTDEIWHAIETLPVPIEPRVLGPLMMRAEREGRVRKTDRIVASDRPACHHRPIAVWMTTARPVSDVALAAYTTTKARTIAMPMLFVSEDAAAPQPSNS